ncbi:MAG TPA: chorismate synthase [Candidatus Acidoferrales bacterium]|nr:chorismate synthase [Candidatus Acidoferrales bacterium]
MLRWQTAGESHGQCLTALVSGLPLGVAVDTAFINRELRRRQAGYGRGGRMKIEHDEAQILSGVRHGKTIGSPITLQIENKDWANWEDTLPVEDKPVPAEKQRALTQPRPGHADLAGALKFNLHDARYILERASARETAARVAAGALAKLFLRGFGVEVLSHTVAIGSVKLERVAAWKEIVAACENTDADIRCVDPQIGAAMTELIDRALAERDSLGGVFEVVAHNVPPGLGTHAQWDEKLDGRLAQAVMSIQAVKAVEIGSGVSNAAAFGSQVHDEIGYDSAQRRFTRASNHAGGLEGGMTNGEDVVVRGYLKPISTLRRPLQSVDLVTKETVKAAYERSDVCVVPAAGIIGEAMVALVLAGAMREKFGGDTVEEAQRNFSAYLQQLKAF